MEISLKESLLIMDAMESANLQKLTEISTKDNSETTSSKEEESM